MQYMKNDNKNEKNSKKIYELYKKEKNIQEREKNIVCFFEERIAIILLVTGSY